MEATTKAKPSKEEILEMNQKFDQHAVPEFTRQFRGYNTIEVDRYLNALVDAYLAMYAECLQLQAQADELRESKLAIANILLDAEQTAQRMLDDAKNQSPERYSAVSGNNENGYEEYAEITA